MSARAHSIRVTFAFIVLITSASIGAGRVSATPPGEPGLIAIGCEAGLWTVEPDGDNLILVTDAEALNPDWSPAGTMIAFTRVEEPAKASVWVMDADGSNELRLTNPTGEARDPSWYPNAEQVAYSFKQTGPQVIRVVQSTLPNNSHAEIYPPASVDDPAVSPDGERILVVASFNGGPQSIWKSTNAAYAVAPTISPPAGSADGSPDWAPSGDRFAFVRDDGATRSIHSVDRDGTDLLRLTDETVDAVSPTYAADGGRIAYLSRPAADAGTDAAFDLWTMDADGANKSLVLADVACEHVDWQPVLDPPLVAASTSSFEAAIIWAYQERIASGCAPERFCPLRSVTRGQVATFLARAMDLPAATLDHFGDDNGTTHEDDINRLAEAGLTSGCGANRYCPANRLTRAELASFLARALELPDATMDWFDDDDGKTHEANINRIAEAGLTSGCAERMFCPDRPISRGETMALVYRAFGP